MSDDAPMWTKISIKDVTKKTSQQKPRDEDNIIYIDIGSIDRENKKIFTPHYIKGMDAPSRARKKIKKNDILVSLTRPNLNAVAIVTEEYDGQYASTGFDVLRPEGIYPKFLFYLVQTGDFVNTISGRTKGALYPAAKASDVRSYTFFMPPIDVQEKIANQLDLLFERLHSAKARLENIPLLLKRFRLSVLAHAVSGELTEDWRIEHRVDNWTLVRLDEVADGFNYGSSFKSSKSGTVPVLRMGNIQDGNIDWNDLVYTSNIDEIQKYKLNVGDVLFNRTNSPELVGKTAIYRGEMKAIYAGYLIRVRGTERLDNEYMNIQLNSPHAKDYCWKVKTDGVSQSNINAQKLKAYTFNLPSINEQKEIVRIVTELLEKAETVRVQYDLAMQKISTLSKSILSKFYRVEVPQNISKKINNPLKNECLNVTASSFKTNELPVNEENSAPDNFFSREKNEVSDLLSKIRKFPAGISAQDLFNESLVNTFQEVDNIFVEIKKLYELKLIEVIGNGQHCKFKVSKK